MHIITVQDSFEDVIRDVENGTIESEKFWLARRVDDQALLQYFKINAFLTQEKTLDFTGESESQYANIKFKIDGPRKYIATIEDKSGIESYTLLSPRFKKSIEKKDQITLLLLNKSTKQIYQGTLSGNILVFDQGSGQKLGEIEEAHLSSVKHLVLLPSDKVLLSAGDDLRICLWDLSADTLPKVATRTFMSQTKTITDVAIIGRGRNFVTSSEDGSVAIWECSSERVVTEFRRVTNRTDPAKCMVVSTSQIEPEENQFRPELLFECIQKVLFVGYGLGLIQQYSVARNCPTNFKFQGNAAVTSIRVWEDLVVAGFANGLLVLWNWKQGTSHELQLNQNHAVEHIYICVEQPSLKLIAYNGPETLIKIGFDGIEFSISYLVGLQEMFQVLLIGECVSTSDEIVFF